MLQEESLKPQQTPDKQTPLKKEVEEEKYSRGAVDSKYESELISSLKSSASQTEFDYIKFKAAIEDMQDDVPEEGARFKAVFKTIKSLGVTPKKLITDVSKCINVLKQEQDEFNEKVLGSLQEDITSKEQGFSNLEQAISEKNKTILKLQKEIEDATSQKTQLKTEIESSKAKLQNKKANFEQTLKKLVSDLKSDSDKIKLYLGE
jgi:DNA repair exonuclease SbcCD ATPase subunit